MIQNTNEQKNVIIKKTVEDSKKGLPLLVVFIVPCILISILYLLFKDNYFQGTSRMHDLIIDQIAMDGSNKTGEWEFFWGLLWIGCFCILGLFLIKEVCLPPDGAFRVLSCHLPIQPHGIFPLPLKKFLPC